LVGKLLVTESSDRLNDERDHLRRSLDEVLGFVDRRLKRYVRQKRADRLFFPDELMQFLAWRQSVLARPRTGGRGGRA